MVKYNPRARKGRSSLQKQQTERTRREALARRQQSLNAETLPDSKSPSNSTLRVETVNTTSNVGSKLKEMKRIVEKLRRNYKNALQREKNAKQKIYRLQQAADLKCEQLSRLCQERESAEIELKRLHLQADVGTREVFELHEQVNQLKHRVTQSSQELVATSTNLKNQLNRSLILEARNKDLHRSRDALRKRFQRIQKRLTRTQAHNEAITSNIVKFSLKDRTGAIRQEVRDMLKNLACEGVSMKSISSVISIVAQGLGVEVLGSISAHSVARVMFEGLVEARMQLGYELGQAKSVSLCGDGTTIKNKQHEAKAMYLQLPACSDSGAQDRSEQKQDPYTLRALGVDKAINHTAQQQLDGWISWIDLCCDTLARSPLGQDFHISSKLVAPKLRGLLTDHAADQKRFRELLRQWKQNCDRQARALPTLNKMSTKGQLDVLSTYLDNAADSIQDWRSLPNEQQSAIMHDAWLALVHQIGDAEFQKLSPEAQFDVDFLAWAGCCMHKELNVVKGGVSSMASAWKKYKLNRPIPLMNKYEVGTKSTQEDSCSRGAIKYVILMGTLFKNRDDKKGYQETVDCFFEDRFGYSKRLPDTSRTRYSSYCDAAIEVFLHLQSYKELMGILRWAKGAGTFNNIESNIFVALDDPATLTELAVLALYAQAVGRPYMRQVRGDISNALELGSFHDKVKQHCKDIINDPDLLLAPDAQVTGSTLDGQPWDEPQVIYRIIKLLPSLLDICLMIVAFFEGALEAWHRFTTEFDSDGIIAQSTLEQLQSARVPPTNDVSEGLLGQCRQALRRAPTMTDAQRNARVMWKQNETPKWTKNMLTSEDRKFIRKEARKIDGNGENRAMRLARNASLEQRAKENKLRLEKAAEKRTAQKAKLEKIELVEGATYEALVNMRVKELDLQIDKLRASGDRLVRPKSMISNKNGKIKEILAALERRREASTQGETTNDIGANSTIDLHVTTTVMEEETCPDDIELCFANEVVF